MIKELQELRKEIQSIKKILFFFFFKSSSLNLTEIWWWGYPEDQVIGLLNFFKIANSTWTRKHNTDCPLSKKNNFQIHQKGNCEVLS